MITVIYPLFTFTFPVTTLLFSFILPPSVYDLRPIASSSFFRLETPFLTFLALLYYSMNQLLIYPFYINRPSFVHHTHILSISYPHPSYTLFSPKLLSTPFRSSPFPSEFSYQSDFIRQVRPVKKLFLSLPIC